MATEQTQTKQCDACGASVTYTGHRGFKDAHQCPLANTSAIDLANDKKPCPTHGTLVWKVGPYSTFRQCASSYCTSGVNSKGQPNHKPWRYCAPRGEAVTNNSIRPTEDDSPISRGAFGGDERDQYATSNETQEDSIMAATAATTVISTPPAPIAAVNGNAVQQALATLMGAMAPQLDEGKVRTMIAEMLDAKLAERIQTSLVIEQRETESKIEIDSPHPYLARVIRLVEAGIPVYLWGPAGGGKTTAAMQVAKALGLESEIDTLDPSTFRSMVQGFMSPNGEHVPTSFTRCWEGGKLYIPDEVDNSPGHVQTLFNSALANGHAPLAWGNIERGNGFGFVGTGNTPGRPTREFPDRKPMSAAFADRLYFVYWPLDEASERRWAGVGGKAKNAVAANGKAREVSADAWVDFVQNLRDWARTNAPTLMITPRASLSGLKALACGESPEQVADGLIFRGADAELRNKALKAVGIP